MMSHRMTAWTASAWIVGVLLPLAVSGDTRDDDLRGEAVAAMRRAATYYRERVAVHGGYVYYYSLDLKERLGEGAATREQIWVQPPGTPTVGMAYLAAYQATRDPYYLDAVRETARALLYGQLESGGWTNSIDFDPQGKGVARYRNGKGRGRNNSTLDDDISQSALRFLMRADQAFEFKDADIHRAVEIALDAMLKAQFPNGGFPQIWTGPVAPQPVVQASFPDYDWRTENRVKEYWNLYTLNDDLAGHVADTLLAALEIYNDERCRTALVKLGDFLVLAQLPEPQPAWAQQYDFQMRPAWARKFEPPAVTGRESQDAIETLLKVSRLTGDAKYLEPIPRALAYLKASRLPDGRLARYYELRTNKPLYITESYELTHDDSRVPAHYGWKVSSHLDALERRSTQLKERRPEPAAKRDVAALRRQARDIVGELDAEGRWVSQRAAERLVGQPKFPAGEKYLASEVFSRNLETLSAFLIAERP
jgi:PelA/Pel-15E family pectate lyase